MDNIKIIGTSHISKESILEVRKAVEEYSPDAIAIELDLMRFQALVSKNKKKDTRRMIKELGFKVLILNFIGSWVENKLGKKVGITPGSEMLEAVKLAKKHDKKLYLIDQDIRITLKKLVNEVTFKEKFRIFLDILKAPFVKKEMKKVDLSKVPEEDLIDEMLKIIKKRYPNIHRILIAERNKVMAKNLYKLINRDKDSKILAIMGAGHKKEVEKMISHGFN